MIWNDIVDLDPISQFAFDRILLVGDSAHATTPNMGQGACQAIEDAVVLKEEIAAATNPLQAFKNFEKRRLPRTHKIVHASWKLGQIGQLQNCCLRAIRNFVFRRMPASIGRKQLEFLFQVDF